MNLDIIDFQNIQDGQFLNLSNRFVICSKESFETRFLLCVSNNYNKLPIHPEFKRNWSNEKKTGKWRWISHHESSIFKFRDKIKTLARSRRHIRLKMIRNIQSSAEEVIKPVNPVRTDLSLIGGRLFFLPFVVFHLYLHINNTHRHTGTSDCSVSVCVYAHVCVSDLFSFSWVSAWPCDQMFVCIKVCVRQTDQGRQSDTHMQEMKKQYKRACTHTRVGTHINKAAH